MEERTTLGVDVQVNLKQILGLEKLDEISSQVKNKFQPDYVSGNVQDMFLGNRPILGSESNSFKTAFSKILPNAENVDYLQANLMQDLTEGQGKLDFNAAGDYLRQIGRLRTDAIRASSRLTEYFEKNHPMDEPLREKITEGAKSYVASIDNIRDQIKKLYDESQKAESGIKGLVQAISAIGVASFIANQAVKGTNLYMEGQVMEAQIGKKQALAWDLTSPIATYTAGEEADLYERQRRRKREADVNSYLYGGPGGALLAGGIALAAGVSGGTALAIGGIGYMAGQNILGSILGGQADIANIEDETAVQERLRTISQSFQIVNQDTQRYRQYDIARMQETARLGSRAGRRILGGLGYTAEQEVGFENAFSEGLGRYDQGLFVEQTRMGRGLGIDPRNFYSLNRLTQLTGQEINPEFVANADILRKQLYGENSDNKKIIDVLTAQKDLLEKILNVNVDTNNKSIFELSNIPRMLFGSDSAYGRIDLLGGRTLQLMEGLMQPKSLAHEAFLYQTLNPNNLVDFEEMKKAGLLGGSPETRKKMFETMGTLGQVLSPTHMYYALDQMMPGAPAGFITQFSKLFQQGYIDVPEGGESKRISLKEFIEGTKESKEAIEKLTKEYDKNGNKFVSNSERILTSINDIQLKIGESWNRTIGKIEIDTQNIFSKVGGSAETFRRLTEGFQTGLKGINHQLGLMGMLSPEAYAMDIEDYLKEHWGEKTFGDDFEKIKKSVYELYDPKITPEQRSKLHKTLREYHNRFYEDDIKEKAKINKKYEETHQTGRSILMNLDAPSSLEQLMIEQNNLLSSLINKRTEAPNLIMSVVGSNPTEHYETQISSYDYFG